MRTKEADDDSGKEKEHPRCLCCSQALVESSRGHGIAQTRLHQSVPDTIRLDVSHEHRVERERGDGRARQSLPGSQEL